MGVCVLGRLVHGNVSTTYSDKKVIYSVNVNFTPEQAMKAQRRSRWLYSFFNLGDKWGWVVNATSLPLYLPEREPVRIRQEAGWAPGAVWTGAENLDPTVPPVGSRHDYTTPAQFTLHALTNYQ